MAIRKFQRGTRTTLSTFSLLSLLAASACGDENLARPQVETALQRAVSFFHSIANRGGYVYYVTPDLDRRWGEGILDETTIEVQPPGTPAVGMAFLQVYIATDSKTALSAARAAAKALIEGQNELGGWQHTIRFDRPAGNMVSFDDDQTQSALSFLMLLDQEVDDPELDAAIAKGLSLMARSQLDNGGWPHRFPEQGNYHDYATFNDEGINDCLRVMIEADRFYGDPVHKRVLEAAGRFLMISQLPPPQPGWAQQYNQYLQPAWARSFEPPSVCPSVTLNNINSLIDLYLHFGDAAYLEPITDALGWLESIRLENGKWARFVEIHTNKPLYYDRGRIRVDHLEQLSEERRLGYSYQVDLGGKLDSARSRFLKARELGQAAYLAQSLQAPATKDSDRRRDALSKRVADIISEMDAKGRWITKGDRFKKREPGKLWDGEYEILDRISSRVFIDNVNTLVEYLQLIDSGG